MKRGDRRIEMATKRRYFRTLPGVLPVVLIGAALTVLASCGEAANRRNLAERMAAEEGRGDDDERIAELRAEIRMVDAQVERTLDAVRQKGTYWRLLGLKYMDFQMWGEAMKAFDEAVAIEPERAVLLYNRGLCAGQMALSADTPETRASYIDRAEFGYRRSLEVDPRYTASMYALAVVLAFERNDPVEASGLLERYLGIERSDVPARFLLARCYLDMGRAGDALALYDQIIDLARDEADAARARDLANRVAGGDYGS